MSRKLRKTAIRAILLSVGLIALTPQNAFSEVKQAIIYAHDKDFRPTVLADKYSWSTGIGLEGSFYRPDASRSYNGFTGQEDGSDIEIHPAYHEDYGAPYQSPVYYVYIPGASLNGWSTAERRDHIIVQAVGPDATLCHVDDPSPTGGAHPEELVAVRCTAPTEFVMRVVGDRPGASNSSGPGASYVSVFPDYHFPGSFSGEFDVVNSGNSAEVLRNGVGNYTIFVDDTLPFGAPHVDGSVRKNPTHPRWDNVHCTVDGPYFAGGGKISFTVQCMGNFFGTEWVPRDTSFSFFFEEHQHSASDTFSVFGGQTAVADNQNWQDMLVADAWGDVVAESILVPFLGEGVYLVHYTNAGAFSDQVPGLRTVPSVTATRSGPVHCKPIGMPFTSNPGGAMFVHCFDLYGNPTQSRFIQSLHWKI